MKPLILTVLFTVWSAPLQAQTFVYYVVSTTNNTVTFGVPSNTLFKAVNVIPNNQADLGTITVQFPNDPGWHQLWSPGGLQNYAPTFQQQILGPAQIKFVKTSSGSGLQYLLADFEPANIAPAAGIGAVQLPGSVASVVLQSSTNLKAWSGETTNTSALSSNAPVKFFRVQLQ